MFPFVKNNLCLLTSHTYEALAERMVAKLNKIGYVSTLFLYNHTSNCYTESNHDGKEFSHLLIFVPKNDIERPNVINMILGLQETLFRREHIYLFTDCTFDDLSSLIGINIENIHLHCNIKSAIALLRIIRKEITIYSSATCKTLCSDGSVLNESDKIGGGIGRVVAAAGSFAFGMPVGAIGGVVLGAAVLGWHNVFSGIEDTICSFLPKIKQKRNSKRTVYSSVYAPTEISRNDHMIIQVFLYQKGEEQKVKEKATIVDSKTEIKNYTPLSVIVNTGDVVTVSLTMEDEKIVLREPVLNLFWQGCYTDCQFSIYIPKQYKKDSIVGTIVLSVNGVPAGRMMFKTSVVANPHYAYTRIKSHKFKKIFISYSHMDEDKVKYIAHAYKLQGTDHFFDREYLKSGDVYPDIIKEYINTADMFLLCWSKNAANSEYVQLECKQALSLAYPQIDAEKATLTLCPISIEPKAGLPNNMNQHYHFENI